MPICPRCNSSIHTGAEEECPACGYGMKRADAMFGDQDIEFTRIVDEAGALTHKERVSLLRFLASLERNIAPVALCIYITNHGQLRDVRTHAHWALNHVRIHRPSFGPREYNVADIEDAELRERMPGEERPVEEMEPPTGWEKFCAFWRDLFIPYPQPARQDWVLMLVVDVQLEVACFTWGYMLDPYIEADDISASIVEGKLQFRERMMVSALKRVMSFAVRHVAKSSRRVNKILSRRGYGRRFAGTLLAAGVGGSLLAAPYAVAQEATPAAQPAEVAPAAEGGAEAPAPEAQPPAEAPPAAPPVVPGAPAAYNAEPKWSSVDYVHLMSGRLPDGYNLLMPEGKQRTAPATPTGKAGRKPAGEESDTNVPGRYCKFYMDARGTALRDPQQLLSDVERDDVMHLLRELNAHSRFHIYVSVFKAEQLVPRELAAATLVSHVAQPGQYTAMLQFGVGEPPTIELGYSEIRPTDEQVREWQERVRRSVYAAGSGAAGVLAAIRSLHASIEPLSEGFTPLTPETTSNVRTIELPLKPKPKVEEPPSGVDSVMEKVASGEALPHVILVCMLGIIGLIYWRLNHWRRGYGRLFSSEPDYRLGSRYGAGVSRYVRYMHGQTSAKEKSPV